MIIFVIFAFSPVLAIAKATEVGSYYVVSKALNERLAPSKNGKVTNKIYRQQRVEVFEFQGDWSMVSSLGPVRFDKRLLEIGHSSW